MITKKNIKNTLILTLVFAGLSVFTACNRSEGSAQHEEHATESEEHQHDGEKGHETHDEQLHSLRESLEQEEVLITRKQMETVGIKLGEVSREKLSNVVKAFGEITLPPTGEATVSPFIGGVITDISVIEGDYVEKGRKIARIEHPDIVELQRDYLEAKNNNEYLEAEYRRQKQLYQDSVNAAKTVQKVKSEYQTNRAQLQSLKKKLELIHLNPGNLTYESLKKGYPVRAPISGHVSAIMVSTGDNVSPQKQLFHITDNQKAHIDLEVYEKDIDKIRKGQRLTFNLANNPLSSAMKGSILKKSHRFNRDSRTALVHADIDKIKTTLLPGMSVIAHIQTGGKHQLALSQSAIVSDQGKDYVFKLQRSVAKESGHDHEEHQHKNEEAHHEHESNGKYFIFKRMEISKGISEAGFTGVYFNESVDDNARFVIDNPQAVISEMKSGGDGHGHAH